MPKPRLRSPDLQKVKDQGSLLSLLRTSLGWPIIDSEDAQPHTVAEVGTVCVRQLLPFASDDPWLIFLVEFEGTFNKDQVRATLREVRRQQRHLGKFEGKGISDILFICAAQDYSEIQFVRFIERGSRQPKVKAFGWNPNTANQNKTVCEICLPALWLEATDNGQPDWSKARWGQAWDVEKVTREFFNGFDVLRKKTLSLLQPAFGDDKDSANWATSVQLNRLLFIYFLADQGFLAGGVLRLRTSLANGNFHAWFTTLALDALGKPGDRPVGFESVPYLNGGLFVLHETEENRNVSLPDSHYEEWLLFLGSFRWTLSESEGVNTISPHILGYLFERYINQKQMGAYYTKEDVTGYICRSTVIPRLFDKIAEARQRSVHLDIGALSKEGNRRYVFPGIKQPSLLPEESEYEFQQRRERLKRLESADLTSVDDFLTHNLDIELLAEDWLATRKDPAELLAAYQALQNITVLDPTVGSGAFLLAALEILAPLYEIALRRMHEMLDVAGKTTSGVTFDGRLALDTEQLSFEEPAVRSGELEAMEREFAEVAKHPNPSYFIRKRILLRNLYGVDLMPEAVEICKLRLYLGLLSSADQQTTLEPLPDLDFNYQAGNSLVGYATLGDRAKVRQQAVVSEGNRMAVFDFDGDNAQLRLEMHEFGTMLRAFSLQQLESTSVPVVSKDKLRRAAGMLYDKLHRDLYDVYKLHDALSVSEFDPKTGKPKKVERSFDSFVQSHHPFHWPLRFPQVEAVGGFDVVVGNPPWKEITATKEEYRLVGYSTAQCGNLYAIAAERALNLRAENGYFSFIVQLPATCSTRMAELRKLLRANSSLLVAVPFDDRPSKLFEGLENCRSVILTSRGKRGTDEAQLSVAGYQRWHTVARQFVFQQLEPVAVATEGHILDVFPKYKCGLEEHIMRAVRLASDKCLGDLLIEEASEHFVFYQEAARYWMKASTEFPFYAKNGVVMKQPHGRTLFFQSARQASAANCLIHSSLFYILFVSHTDAFHLSQTLVEITPIPEVMLQDDRLFNLNTKLVTKLKQTALRKTMKTREGATIVYDEFQSRECKEIIDEIDGVLAEHYRFTAEQLQFIINYDLKYRIRWLPRSKSPL